MNFIIAWILDLFRPVEMPTAPIKAQRKPRAPAKKKPAKIQSAPTKGNFSKTEIRAAIKKAKEKK